MRLKPYQQRYRLELDAIDRDALLFALKLLSDGYKSQITLAPEHAEDWAFLRQEVRALRARIRKLRRLNGAEPG